MELQGKTVLITGAARRIGREIALTLADSGASIVIHYNRSGREALRLKKEIEADGIQAITLSADFASRRKPLLPVIKDFVRKVYRQVRRVDILINNASIFYRTPFEKITEKNWDDFLTVNLKAPFFLAQEIGLRMLRQRSGKIVNIVDCAGLQTAAQYLPYGISKAGLAAATIGLAKALAPYVQVNSIAPGPILPAKGTTAKREAAVIKKTLLKRYGHPRDIAETVRFLIEGSDFITGTVIPVDGGASLA